MEGNESPRKGLKYIGPDNALTKAIHQVVKTIDPDLLTQNLAILTDTADQYVMEALEILQTDPEIKLIIVTMHGKKGILDHSLYYMAPLAKSPRVRIADTLQIAGIFAAARELCDTSAEINTDTGRSSVPDAPVLLKLDPAVLETGIAIKQRALAVIQHDLKNLPEREGDRYEQLIAKARNILGAQSQIKDEEVEKLVMASQTKIQRTVERNLKGVYCDVENTLLKPDGSLNMEILTLLKGYVRTGKQVTIWTGGDLETVARKLETAAAALENDGDKETACMLRNLDLVSKYDYAGANVETVIDDMLPEEIFLTFRIKPWNFIRS